MRGEAYLAEHQATEATGEFRRILEHPGIVTSDPVGSLTYLQLGRAYAMGGENAKAMSAYEDFLPLWKGADSDLAILKQARVEYAAIASKRRTSDRSAKQYVSEPIH